MKLGTERRLGATDAAKLLGVSKRGNAADVYARYVFGIEATPNKAMDRGTRYEPVVRTMYRAEHGVEFMRWVTSPVVLQHEHHEWATSSPDDVTIDGRLVEYKTVTTWAAKQWVDGPPVGYVLQCCWSMWVADLPTCHLYAAFGEDVGEEFRIDYCRTYELARDAELERVFFVAGERFWREHVVPRRPPDFEPLNAKRKWRSAIKAAQTSVPTNEEAT